MDNLGDTGKGAGFLACPFFCPGIRRCYPGWNVPLRRLGLDATHHGQCRLGRQIVVG